jgi:hypothetical protein
VNVTGWTLGYAPLAKVLTASGDISTITIARGLITMPETDAVVSADLTYGETIAVGQAVYQKSSNSKLYKTLTGTRSQGTLTFAGNAQNNEAVVLGAQTYTWKTTLTGAADEVKIGATAEDSIDNLVAAINDAGVEGTNYGVGTTANASATAVKGSSTTLVATAITPGAAGDTVVSTETMTDGSWDAATLGTTTAGVDGGEVSDAFYGIALDAGVLNDTGKRIQVRGLCEVLSGLTVGAQYLSDTSGAITNSAPTSYKRRVGYAIAATKMLIDPSQSPADLSGANSDTTVANFREAMTFFGATGITGAEAETLTDGSDAGSLHVHTTYDGALAECNNLATVTVPLFMTPESGWNETITAGGNITKRISSTYFETDNTTGADAVMYSGFMSDSDLSYTIPDWDQNISMVMVVILASTTNQDMFWGIGGSSTAIEADATLTTQHAGFFVQDGTLYASIADGSTQTKSDVTSGITLTNMNSYEIIHTAGTNIVFKINGTTVATVSTNLPAATATGMAARIGATSQENNYKGLAVLNNATVKIELA